MLIVGGHSHTPVLYSVGRRTDVLQRQHGALICTIIV